MVHTNKNREKRKRRTIKKTHKSSHQQIIGFIDTMFSLQATLKMIHWTTTSYAIHKATDKTIQILLPLIDGFVETYLGKHSGALQQHDITHVTIKKIETTTQLQKYLEKVIRKLDHTMKLKDGDLISIKDDIVSELNVLKYLLDLKE